MTANSFDRSVTRALIPCGGRGTRMLALTKGAPKELIDVGGLPALVRVLGECGASGITDVIIVIAPDKDAIVETSKRAAGLSGMPARISFVVQEKPRGLADAIRLGRDFAAGQPIAVALPDNLFADGEPALAQVIETYLKTEMNVVAVVPISAEEASRRGPTSIYEGIANQNEFTITKLPGKGERGSTFDTHGAASALTGVGRLVFTTDAFDAIDAVAKTMSPGEELDDVPVMQRLLAKHRLIGRRIEGRFFDIGLEPGYYEANAALSA
jgi:UTP--glucose-1-phosphate uridylyltransferase